MNPYAPPLGEHRSYPAKVSTVLFPAPWRVCSFDGRAPEEFARTVFDAALAAWLEHMEVPC